MREMNYVFMKVNVLLEDTNYEINFYFIINLTILSLNKALDISLKSFLGLIFFMFLAIKTTTASRKEEASTDSASLPRAT